MATVCASLRCSDGAGLMYRREGGDAAPCYTAGGFARRVVASHARNHARAGACIVCCFRRLADGRPRSARHALQPARPDQRRQCRLAEARLQLPDRHREGPRGRAAGDRRHDVPRHALPELGVRARPAPTRRERQVEVRSQAGGERARRRLLRCRQSRRRVRRRAPVHQHARHADDRDRRRQRTRALAHQARRHLARRDGDDGAARRRRQGLRRQQRRRARRARLDDRARRRDRQDRLARVEHRARQRRPHRPVVQALLRAGQGQGPRHGDLARHEPGRSAAARRGASCRTTPSSTSSSTAPATRARGIRSSAPASTSGARASSRASPRRAKRSGTTSGARTTCTTTTASTRTSSSTCRSAARDRRGHRPPRPQRLRLRGRPRQRPGALGRSVRADHDLDRRRPRDRRAQVQPAEGPAQRRDDAQHLPGLAGRQGLAAVGVVAAHEAALHPAPEPVRGRRPLPGELHRRHALRRRRHQDVRRPRRPPRRVHRLGPGRAQEGLGAEGELPGVERRARDRRRRRLLRHHGRQLQGRRREERQAAVAVQDRAPA